MKKLLIIIFLGAFIFISRDCWAQTTIPTKDQRLINAMTQTADGGLHFGMMFSIDPKTHNTIWLNKYKGKFYTPYPYMVKCVQSVMTVYDVRKSKTIPMYTLPEHCNLKTLHI